MKLFDNFFIGDWFFKLITGKFPFQHREKEERMSWHLSFYFYLFFATEKGHSLFTLTLYFNLKIKRDYKKSYERFVYESVDDGSVKNAIKLISA